MFRNDVFLDVSLARIDVSEERIASFVSVAKISELGTALAVTSN
jgi:hypothetical protein